MIISQETIDQVRQLDAHTVIEKYISLEKSGKDHLAICPFHEDKKPSMRVYANNFFCWSCNKAGDAIKFVCEKNNLKFLDAVELIAKDHNISVKYEDRQNGYSTEQYKEKQKEKESKRDALNFAQKYFQSNLPQILPYLENRKFDLPTIYKFGLGFAPRTNFFTKRAKEIWKELDLVKVGKENLYDTFRERLMIPLLEKSYIVGYAGRAVKQEQKIKYINNAETEFYKKGDFLYGLSEAEKEIKKQNLVYLVEGYPNVWRMSQIGLENTIATGGTSLSDQQIKLIAKSTKNIVLVYDGDPAGITATNKNLVELLKNDFHVKIATVPQGHDVDSWFVDFVGKDDVKTENQYLHFINLLQENTSFWLDLKIKNYKETKNKDLNTETEFVHHLVDLITNLSDLTLQSSLSDIACKSFKNFKVAFKTKQKEIKEKKQENANLADVLMNKEGTFVMNARGFPTKIADFQMKLIYQLATENVKDCKWIMEVKNHSPKFTKYIVLSNDEITKNQALDSALFREQLSLNADDKQSKALRKYLICNGVKKAEMVDVLGYHVESKCLFFWANKAFDWRSNEILTPNELGILEHSSGTYFMPYHNEKLVSDDSKANFKYEYSKITFNEIASFVAENWGAESAILALSFFLASLFADFIITANSSINAYFPIPFLVGQGGTGKSMLNKILMNFYAKGFGEYSMSSSSTMAGMTETLSSFSNVVVHLEDYNKSNNLEGLSNFLTDFWGRQFKRKMDMKNAGSAKINKARATVTVSSNIPPLDSDGSGAFPSRVVYQSLNVDSRPTAQKIKFENRLAELSSQSWTQVTCELLSKRDIVEKHFQTQEKAISIRVGELLKKADITVKDRVIKNFCLLGAIYEVFVMYGGIKKLTEKQYIDEIIFNAIVKQHRSLVEKSPIQVFWDLFQTGVNRFEFAFSQRAEWHDKNGDVKTANVQLRPDYVIPHCHYKIKDKYEVAHETIIDDKVLIIKLADCYEYYLKQCKILGIKAMTDSTFKNEMRLHRSYDKTIITDGKGKTRETSSLAAWRFDLAEGQKTSATTKAFVLKLEALQEDFGLEIDRKTH